MPNLKAGAKEVSIKIFHAPCAFNPKGVSKSICMSTTRVIQRNASCCSIRCTSPVRACRACLFEGGEPQNVADPESGLCTFHSENGPETKRLGFTAKRSMPAHSRTETSHLAMMLMNRRAQGKTRAFKD